MQAKEKKKKLLNKKPEQQKQYNKQDLSGPKMGFGRGRESSFPFIKNQSETTIVKQLY